MRRYIHIRNQMMRKKRKRKIGSWQILKLSSFAQKERDDCELYEQLFRALSFHLPLRIVSVIIFFQKEEYVRKPGSLVALYRVSEGTVAPVSDFLDRYEAYYAVLKKEGYL